MLSPRLQTLTGLSTQPASLVITDLEACEKFPSMTEYECTICLSSYSNSEILTTCLQDHKFCKNCLHLFIKSQITEFKGEAITCPQDSCTQSCDENIIRFLLNNQEIKLYEQKKLEKIVSRNPHMKFCPQAGCSRVYKPSKSKNFTVCKCHSKICNACGELWHEGKTCKQVADPGFEEYVKGNEVKFCVMCKTVVQKIEGCLHITCPVCDYEWCWSCGREYTPLHVAKCPKEWMPEPPKRVVSEQKMTWESKRTQAIMDNLFYVLSLPLKLFFLPFVLFNLWGMMMDADKIAKKIVLFSLGIIFSLIYDAILFAVVAGIINGDPVLIIVLLIILSPYFCYILPDIIRTFRKGKFHNKRWMSRNVEMFGFKASKAVPNAQNAENQNGAQAQPEEETENQTQKPEIIVIKPKGPIAEEKNNDELREIQIVSMS